MTKRSNNAPTRKQIPAAAHDAATELQMEISSMTTAPQMREIAFNQIGQCD